MFVSADALAAKMCASRAREKNHRGQCRGCGHGVANADFDARARVTCGGGDEADRTHPACLTR